MVADHTFLSLLHSSAINNQHVSPCFAGHRSPELTSGCLGRSTTHAAPSQNDHIANVDPVTEHDLHDIEATFETDEGEGWVAYARVLSVAKGTSRTS